MVFAALVSLPIGASPAVGPKLNLEPTWRSYGWPPGDLNGLGGTLAQNWAMDDPPTSLLDRTWEQQFSKLVILANYANTAGWTADNTATTTDLDTVLKDGKAAANPTEFEELAGLIEFRRDVLDEALTQADSILPYFAGVLNFKASTHPYTYLLAATAESVGLLVAMYWKSKYNRVRPSRRFPELMPPVDVPGHASFPSGHATQSYLIALCLAGVMPAAAWQSKDTTASNKEVFDPDPLSIVSKDTSGATVEGISRGPLFRMAERIARNREVLGLHYPSDSRAGKLLAQAVHKLLLVTLKSIKPRNGTDNLVELAKAEWPTVVAIEPIKRKPIKPKV